MPDSKDLKRTGIFRICSGHRLFQKMREAGYYIKNAHSLSIVHETDRVSVTLGISPRNKRTMLGKICSGKIVVECLTTKVNSSRTDKELLHQYPTLKRGLYPMGPP